MIFKYGNMSLHTVIDFGAKYYVDTVGKEHPKGELGVHS